MHSKRASEPRRARARTQTLKWKGQHMRYEVTLPELGDDSVDRATVTQWLVDEGDIVSEKDDLVEMITDKAAFSVPSPKAGTLIEKLVDEDDEVSVGDVLCIIEI